MMNRVPGESNAAKIVESLVEDYTDRNFSNEIDDS